MFVKTEIVRRPMARNQRFLGEIGEIDMREVSIHQTSFDEKFLVARHNT